MNIPDGPLRSSIEFNKGKTVYEEYTQYYINDTNMLIKETTTRSWTNGDYIDSIVTTPLVSIEK